MVPRLSIRPSWKRLPLFLRAALATLPFLAVTIYLFVQSRGFERQLLETETTREADYVSLQIQSFVAARVGALRSVGSFELAEATASRRYEFRGFINRLVSEVPDFAAIDWIDAQGVAHPQTSAPRPGLILPDLNGEEFAAARDKARVSHQPASTGSFALGPYEQGFAVFVPVYRNGALDGVVAGTVRLTPSLRELLGRDVLDFWNIELKDRAERTAYLSVGTAGGPASPSPDYMAPPRFVPVADHAWRLRLWPTPLLVATLRTEAPLRILVIGLVATLVVAVANALLARRSAQLQESFQVAQRLAADVDTTRRRLSDLVNGIEAVVWETDLDTSRFTFVNDYARKLLSIEASRWVPEPAFLFAHVHPDDRARARELAREGSSPGQTHAAEYRMINAAGGVLWVREIITVIGEGERMVGRRGVVVDISARVQAEEAVRQSQKLESLGVLAGGIAHDFNNLLTTILGNAEMLGHFLAGAHPTGLGYLDKIERTTRRLAELTRQMLAYSGRGTFSVEKIDLNTIIKEMTELLKVSATKNVHVSHQLDPYLPPMEADAVQIRQVVLNLLTNAAEAIGEQGVGEVTVRTAAEILGGEGGGQPPGQELAPGRYVRLEVRDNGCGMTEETLSKIFDPFFTTKFTGRGLGLAALQGIVRGHRGGVHIASAPGEGTTFTLLFPASAETALDDPHTEHPPGGMRPNVRGLGLLLVDDEDGLRSLMAYALEDEGARVFQAADGEEGLDQFYRHEHEIDVVILDLTMPRLGGEAVLKRIRATHPDMCVILSSGYTEEDINRQFAGQGLSGFIEKPFTPTELVDKIRVVLASDGACGLDFAMRHPERVPKPVAVAVNGRGKSTAGGA